MKYEATIKSSVNMRSPVNMKSSVKGGGFNSLVKSSVNFKVTYKMFICHHLENPISNNSTDTPSQFICKYGGGTVELKGGVCVIKLLIS